MILISKPIKCEKCNNDMDNYSLEHGTNRIIFKCACGHIKVITQDEYREIMRKLS